MKNMRKFLSYYRPYKKLFVLDMFFALVGALVTLAYPLVTRYITGEFLSASELQLGTLAIFVAVYVALVVIEYFSNLFITNYGHNMGAYMESDLRDELFEHYQKLSFGFYDQNNTGVLMSRITNDLFALTELYHHGPEDIVISAIKFLGAFAILLFINVPLTLIIFSFIPVMIIFMLRYNSKMKQAFKANRAKIGDINARVEDNLAGIRVVKSFSNEADEIEKFYQSNQRFVKTKEDSYYYLGRYFSGLTAFTSLISGTTLFAGAYFVARGSISLPDLVAYIMYSANLIDPIKRFMNFTEQFQSGITGFERFMEIIEVKPDIEDRPDAVVLKDVKGVIDFKDVAFRYNDKSDYVLKNLNLHLDSGEYIALVGSSGAGKTTICSLLPRFYEITSGKITIDGTDIRDVTQASLRANIGIVQQDVYLFTGTIMDNIRYGDLDASDEEVMAAARQANAHEFIMELENGYQTDIGQRGVRLSGGQKQRISIARVFLKNPPILIFDEATSALDNESERIVQESLEKLAQNRTTIVIAHRLSTIKNASRICVVTNEGIEESGTHEQLLERNGTYAYLYNMQFKESQSE